MVEESHEKLIRSHISTFHSNWEEYDYLRPFLCNFEVSESDDGDKDIYLGVITGWFGISALDRPIRNEADAISADSATIGSVAQEILDAQDWSDSVIEHILLIDRISIEANYRGQGMLLPMIDTLVSSFGFQKAGCILVTQPEPQKPGGGPYPNGTKRTKALMGLKRSLEVEGFTPWDKGPCYSRVIPVA